MVERMHRTLDPELGGSRGFPDLERLVGGVDDLSSAHRPHDDICRLLENP
jgi:hypothetical protein